MKFILGFFIGLLTGVTIILGPVIAVFVSFGLSGSSDDEAAPDLPVPAQGPGSPGHVRYQGMTQRKPQTPEETLS